MIKKFEEFINESVYGDDKFVSTATDDVKKIEHVDDLITSIELKMDNLGEEGYKRGTMIINADSNIIEKVVKSIELKKSKIKLGGPVIILDDPYDIKDGFEDLLKDYSNSIFIIKDSATRYFISRHNTLSSLKYLKEFNGMIVLFIDGNLKGGDAHFHFSALCSRFDVFEF